MDVSQCGDQCRLVVTDCQVLHKENDLVIYGQFAKDERFINDMTMKIESCCDRMNGVQHASIGTRCLAKFSEDGHWYRAVVMDKSQGSCIVKFMDYGHDQVTLFGDLKSMPTELADIEPLCHEFMLDVDRSPVLGHWTKDVAERLKSKYSYHEVEVKLRRLSGGCFVAKSQDICKCLTDWGFIADSSGANGEELSIAMPRFSVHQRLHVSINDVLPDGSFYCHTLSMESALNDLLEKLYDCYAGRNGEPLTHACKEQYCCVKFCDGNWYRAVIVDIDGNDADVRLVDYGNLARYNLSNLMLLKAEYTSLPAQGIHCNLSSGCRPQEKTKILRGLIDKPVTIEFVNTDLKPYSVRLYYRGALVGLTGANNSTNGLKPIAENNDQVHIKVRKDELDINPQKNSHSFEIPLNCETPIRITYVENPGIIWIQLMDHQAKLIRLTGALNGLYNASQHDMQKIDVKSGQICCVKSHRTHHWCRGIVNFVCNLSVEVKFLDFGFTEVTNLANIKPLKDEYSQLPCFAICCKLDNITPIAGKWCTPSLNYLNEFVAKSGLTAKFLSLDDEVYAAEIYILAQHGRIVLNNEMVQQGFAHFCHSLNADTLANSRPITPGSIVSSSKRYYSHAGVGLVGAQVLVSICVDPTPGEFWVLPCDAKLERTFNQLTLEMNRYSGSSLVPFDKLYPGMPCVYVTRNEVLRAAIVSFEHPKSPEIFFVDIGRKMRVPITSLRPIADEHIYFIHPLAIRCTMCGIIEPKTKFWSTAAIHAFSRFCLENNRNILCTIHACVTDGTSEMAMVKISSPFKDVADILVDMGNCQYVRPFGKLFPPYSLKSYLSYMFTGIGKEETFYVTHAERADLFYCQLTDNFEIIENVMGNVQDYCNSQRASRAMIQELVCAPLCFVKYGDNKWYRAHFISLAPVVEQNYATVFLVDYGNLVNVLVQNIVAFDRNSSLAETPMQAAPCCLSEIVSRLHDHAMADSVLSKLKTLILHKVFPGLVTGSTNGKLHIDLYTDTLQKKRINSAFTEDINPVAVLPPITSTSADNDALLKGHYMDISGTVEVKSCHPVTVAYVKDPSDFYVRLDSREKMFEACCHEVDGRYTAMRCQDYCVTSLNKGDIVCVKRTATLRWCRGVVVDVDSCEENKVLVELVDFGCQEVVSVADSVKKLSADLCQWPKFAIHCQLNNIRPIGKNWNASNRHHFESSCQFSQCRLRFNTYDEAENKWTVDMKVDGKSMARMLVEKKHAVYIVAPASYAESMKNGNEPMKVSVPELPKTGTGLVETLASGELPKTENKLEKTKKNDYFEAGKVSKVYISHVETTGTIYLQLVDMEDALEIMMDKINQSTVIHKSVDNPDMSCSYLNQYDEDDRLYRVNILAIHHDGNIDIIYSDYGNRASVKSSQLYALPKEFLELPEQATKCHVSYPLQIDLHKVVTKLEELAIDEEVSIRARCVKSSSTTEVELDLYKECDDSTTKFVDFFNEKSCSSLVSSCPKSEYEKCDVETGTKLEVFVSQVDSPSQVWIQLSSGTSCLETLMAEIEEFCADGQAVKKPESLEPGMPCLAKYAVDEGWYRGKIVKLLELEALILFVDYGNQETVKIQNILTIDEKFYSLPQQAIQCRLHNVCNMDAWTPSDIAKFVERVSDVELVAYFHHCSEKNDVYDVDLIYPCGKSLNEEWNETLPSCSDIASRDKLTKDSSVMDDNTVISMVNHVVMDRGDHVIVDVIAAPTSKLDFNSSPACETSSISSTSDISINIGCIEDGYISHCEHPGLFYVQLSRLSSTLDEISEEVSLVCETKCSQNISIDIGELCVAKSSDIGLSYRGKCVAKEDGSFWIYFIDYGNTSLVSSSDIMAITPKLSTYPYLAIACKLHELELVGDSWSNATDSFLDLTLDQELKVKFVEHREGIWSVKLALSEDDIGECLLVKHENIVSYNKTIDDMKFAAKPTFRMEVKPGSIMCIKIVNIDPSKEIFHAVQLITPRSELEKIITDWIHDNNQDVLINSISFQNLEVSSYYLAYVQQRWTCVEILEVTEKRGLAVDLINNQLIGLDVHSNVIQCPAEIACMGESILLPCVLPTNQSIEIRLGDIVVVEFKSQDNSESWSVDILSKHTTDDRIVNDLDERRKLSEWTVEHLADLTRFFEIADVIFKDCPRYLKRLSENLLEVKNLMLSTQNIEHFENSAETLKRLNCDTMAKHRECPAKKIKLETCKENWSNAILSKFAVGDNFEAVITSIVHPWKIFLRPYLLISELTSYQRTDGNLDDREEEIVKSKYCLVQVTDTLSNIDHWVRGKFIERKDDSFVFDDLDSGLSLEGTIENIIPVGESLLSWPMFCMECYLTGIKPMNGATSWGTTPTNELNAIMHSLNVADKVEITILAKSTSEESGNNLFGVDLNINKQSLSKRLITMEIATPSDFDKENIINEQSTASDDLFRRSCREPFKELGLCNISVHSPLPITPESIGQDLPIIDLLAVPWKVVRSSREGSKSERLSDSVFVSEAEESGICDPSSHCSKRPMTSFKIYCSNVESDSNQNNVDGYMSLVPKMHGGAVDDENAGCEPTDIIQPSLLGVQSPSSDTDRKHENEYVTNAAFYSDQGIISAEEETNVNELAWEVVERILYDLSIEENKQSGAQANCTDVNVEPQSPHINNLESGIGSPNQEREESSDESHTMVDETCSVGSSSTLPIPLGDETICSEYMVSGDVYSHQQAEEELEEAVQQLNLNEPNNCLLASSGNYDTECEGLAAAAKNLALEDSGCNVDDVEASPRPLTCDDLSSLTDNMQIISMSHSEDVQCAITGLTRCQSHRIGNCNVDNNSNASDCCDLLTKQSSGSMAMTMHCELTLDADECVESKSSEQYYSTESCFTSNNLHCDDKEPFVGGSDYDSAINTELPCTAIDVKGGIDASGVSQGSVSPAHLQSNSNLPENLDNVQEDIRVERDQQDLPPCLEIIESHNGKIGVPELIVTPVDACCCVEGPDELGKDKPDDSGEVIVHSDLQNFAVNICVTSHCNQSIGICCLPPLQIDIGDTFNVSFIRTGADPLSIMLQFDMGADSNDWRKAMIQANTPESTSRLKPCEYFDSDMMCLVASPVSSQERGRIIHFTSNVYKVELIDHGEIVEVKEMNLHKLPEDLCMYPRQSMECHLHGIKIHADNAISRHKWITIICPYLDGFLKGRALRAEILDIDKDNRKVVYIKLSFQEENGSVIDVSEVLVNTGLALLPGHDEFDDDGQWTTIEDSSYEELVKGSDTSVVLHSSNADLSMIEEAFEEDLPEIPQQEAQSPTSEIEFAGVAKSIYATALAGALIVARFGSSDILG